MFEKKNQYEGRGMTGSTGQTDYIGIPRGHRKDRQPKIMTLNHGCPVKLSEEYYVLH